MPTSSLMKQAQWLANRQAQGLYRQTYVRQGQHTNQIIHKGCSYLGFCSNDYLGLANHPAVVAACQQGIKQYGLGATSAHLISGHSEAHEQLEQAFADFIGVESALLFSTGYMANLGVLSGLAERFDEIYSDKLNHASLIDGAKLSGARTKRYRHSDVAQLQKMLATSTAQAWVVSDGVFSMDGDIAALDKIVAIARNASAGLYVDDAHGFGVYGAGRGLFAHFNQTIDETTLYMATLGKAVGVSGAIVGGHSAMIDVLRQKARSWIYTTAMPPALSVAAMKSLQIIRGEEGCALRRRLTQNIQLLREGLMQQGWPLLASDSAIQPIMIGDSEQALKLSNQLKQMGYWVPAIRPPTVPQPRLRITLTANHTESEVLQFVEALSALQPQTQ